jgi:hypothetical protein
MEFRYTSSTMLAFPWDLGKDEDGNGAGTRGGIRLFFTQVQKLVGGTFGSRHRLNRDNHTAYYVKKNGDNESVGMSANAWNPIIFKYSRGGPWTVSKRGAFIDQGDEALAVDMVGNMAGWKANFDGDNLYKLYSTLGFGDELFVSFYGSLRLSCEPGYGPNAAQRANIRADSANSTPGQKPTTFRLSSQSPPSDDNPPDGYTPMIKYKIQIPFKFIVSTQATATAGALPSPRPNWSKVYETSIYSTSNVDTDGGLIILEPIGTEDVDQEVIFSFRNLALGALKLKARNAQCKVASEGEVVDANSTWSSVNGSIIPWAGDWDICTNEDGSSGKIYADYGYYIYQAQASAGYRAVDPTIVTKDFSETNMNRWILYKFDLVVANAMKKCDGSGAYNNRRDENDAYQLYDIRNICVAYRVQSSTAASNQQQATAT